MSPRAFLLVVTMLCAACGMTSISSRCPSCETSEGGPWESNYITFEHPFTDAAAQEVSKRAERICAQRKKLTMKTASTCSLNKCTTHYQCVNKPRPDAPTPPQPVK